VGPVSSYHKSLGYHNSDYPQAARLHNPVHRPPTNRATALPKLQPTKEQTTPDPQPITDSLLVSTKKLSPIAVNHHQPKPRTPLVLAESAQIWPLHLEPLLGIEFCRHPTSKSASCVPKGTYIFLHEIFIVTIKKC
jgi:hypothetical protein